MSAFGWHAAAVVLVLLLAPEEGAAQKAGPPPAPASPSKPLSEHTKADVQRHRAMALAHEAAARCLESGQTEAACLKELQSACKGLAIGKYCGMKHEH